MKVLGIIAEYNPFHNGHKYHLEQSMALTGADCSVAVMSGNFLQRGEPAMWDKRVRAEMAVRNGVDLVVELPFVFACNNAEQFAYGGVSLLNGLGCVTELAFGCEGNPHKLQEAAGFLACESKEYKEALAEALGRGLSYPSARTAALSACGAYEAAELLTQPNNILAAEYLKQCILTHSTMKPRGIHRMDSGYNSLELPETNESSGVKRDKPAAASARAIRSALRKDFGAAAAVNIDRVKDYLPEETIGVMTGQQETGQPKTGQQEVGEEKAACFNSEALFPLIAARLRAASPQELSQIYAVSEGLENLMKKAVLTAADMESLLVEMKTKRYTRTRLQRALIQCLVGLTAEDYRRILSEQIQYAHVLAFGSRGAKLLSYIKKEGCARIPIYSNLSREAAAEAEEQTALKYDLLAADLYHIAANKQIYENSDLVQAPFYLK